MKCHGLEKVMKKFKGKAKNLVKVVAKVLADGAGGSQKSNDFGGDTFKHSDESISDAVYVNKWEMPLESENLINEVRVLCKMITDEAQWHKMKKELLSSQNYSWFRMLETFRGLLVARLPRPLTTENRACPEITEINCTDKCDSGDQVLHCVMKPNGSKMSLGGDEREEIPDETQCDDLGKCKTVIESSIDFKSWSSNPVGDEVLIEDRIISKSALRNLTLFDLVGIIQLRRKMYKNNEILNSVCHDGNRNGDTDKSSSQQTQCQSTDTNATGASYQQAPGKHGMVPLPGGNRDDDGDEENPRKTKKDERIGGCASNEVGETDKKQNANNNRLEGDQPMPDQSLPSGECSEVSQGAAGYERAQSPRSSVPLGPCELSYSISENEDGIPVVDANQCGDHMEALNDDNMQLEVPVHGQMDPNVNGQINSKDFLDQRIYQGENPLRLSMDSDQARGFVRESDVDRRTGKKPSPPRDTRQGDGRQIPPAGVTLGQASVQHAPWSHEPPGRLDPSSSAILPHTQVERFFSKDEYADEEQILLDQTAVQHAPDSHEHPVDSPSSPVLPRGQMDNPSQGSQANEGFFLEDGNAAEGAYSEQIDDHGWRTVQYSPFEQRVAREVDLEINQEVQPSRLDELRLDRTFQHLERVVRTCFSCNMPHIMSQDQNDYCIYCGRFFCLDHFDRHVCIVPRFTEEEEEEAPENMDFDDRGDETDRGGYEEVCNQSSPRSL